MNSKTVLVVEDDEMVLECIILLLQQRQLNVISANNGHDGAALAHACTPDLIVSDLNMDGYDGLQVLRSVREDPGTATVPFVLITATADSDVKQKSYSLGADQLLLKPFDPERLIDTVCGLLAEASGAEPLPAQ